MAGEIDPRTHEHSIAREQFLLNLAEFIIESGKNGWAAEASRVEVPQRPGFKELSYLRGEWEYRDSYAGYFMAPGSSVVYYKRTPVWYMTYGGEGQDPTSFDQAKDTYAFLRRALMKPHDSLPVRGPSHYDEDNLQKIYWFDYEGDLASAKWDELILIDHKKVFSQRGDVGLIIDKDYARRPIYPWALD